MATRCWWTNTGRALLGPARTGQADGLSGLDGIFRPRSIAVVGASRKAESLGRQVLENLLAGEFQGPVYPVNPKAEFVRSIRCHPNLQSLPETPDLVVVCTPAPTVLGVAEDAVAAGARGLVVITAGFKEIGGEGAKLEERLRAVAAGRLRVVGPNCMGVINTDPATRMNATFSARSPAPGGVAFASQSGALGEAILAEMRERNIGLAHFVSLGNKMDLAGNELLEMWGADPRVKTILLYLEGFGDPTRFLTLAREITRTKPIIAVKAGRTAAGARAASSHTGTVAGATVAADRILRQAGVLRANSINEMFDLATAFSHGPLPEGPRVGLVTNAGGPGILATDAAGAMGLEIASLEEGTMERLAQVLPATASRGNPVDMVASAGPREFRECVGAVLADPGVDALITLFVSPATMDTPAVAEAIVEGAEGSSKPVFVVFMGRAGHEEAVASLRAGGLPVFAYPESAARALAGVWEHRHRRDEEPGQVVAAKRDLDSAREALAPAQAAGREWLLPSEAEGLLAAYGIPVIPFATVRTPEEAGEAAEGIGYPAVVKVASGTIVHKTDMGGVAVGLASRREVVGAAHEILAQARAQDPEAKLLVQGMGEGTEVLFGLARHERFGALLAFGMGGILVEVMGDVTTRVAPLTDRDAERMLGEIRGARILQGYRGAPAADQEALRNTLLALSALATDWPEMVELDLNPFFAAPRGANGGVADARVRLAPSPKTQTGTEESP